MADEPQPNGSEKLPRQGSQAAKSFGRWGVGVAVVAAGVWAWSVNHAWRQFKVDLMTYHGVSIGQSKLEVEYALGSPETVQGPEIDQGDGATMSSPLWVHPENARNPKPQMDYDVIPKEKSPKDYDEWHYFETTAPFDVYFDAKNGRVRSISCGESATSKIICDPLLGVKVGMPERDLADVLPQPTESEISGGGRLLGMPIAVTKSMTYEKLGLLLFLQKGRIDRITKTAPQPVSFWWWFKNIWL